jgi:hypothetical protein
MSSRTSATSSTTSSAGRSTCCTQYWTNLIHFILMYIYKGNRSSLARAFCDLKKKGSLPGCMAHSRCILWSIQSTGGMLALLELLPQLINFPPHCTTKTRPESWYCPTCFL